VSIHRNLFDGSGVRCHHHHSDAMGGVSYINEVDCKWNGVIGGVPTNLGG
jgi:hypothetical protein